jgi:hypothetical protein
MFPLGDTGEIPLSETAREPNSKTIYNSYVFGASGLIGPSDLVIASAAKQSRRRTTLLPTRLLRCARNDEVRTVFAPTY